MRRRNDRHRVSDSDRPPARLALLALQFGVELATFAALVYWGWRAGGGGLAGLALGVVAAMAVSVVWAVFGSPNAPRPLPETARLGLRVVILGVATAALVVTGQVVLGAAFAAVALATAALVHRTDL